MSNSLFDQLKKAGLVDEKKANKANKEKRKQAKKQRHNNAVNEEKLHLQQQQANKVKHDRALNLQHQKKINKKAIQAQIRQLVELNQLTDHDGEVIYHFTDNNIIKNIHLSASVHKQLQKGWLAIIKLDNSYRLVPTAVAEKIKQRDETPIIQCHAPQQESEENDYADYTVPDDLMW